MRTRDLHPLQSNRLAIEAAFRIEKYQKRTLNTARAVVTVPRIGVGTGPVERVRLTVDEL